MHAAKLLGSIQAETAVPDLVRLLADPNSYVKDTAIDALNRIGEPAVAHSLRCWTLARETSSPMKISALPQNIDTSRVLILIVYG